MIVSDQSLSHQPPQRDEARYRPLFHFTPRRNWMNDPNGLVWFAGEYHLFYQYNPHGDQWGHMSWGHAVSDDLLTWTELPVAMAEREREMIFSGSIVVDWDNVSGLGTGTEPPFLAFYTGFDQAADIQRQCLAYSNDRGRTFAFHAGNPIIDLDMAHFRDPKVFRHEASGAWVMVVALAREHRVQFYRSTNLLDWHLSGSFGPAGATSGQWECPELIEVDIEGVDDRRWVLKVDVDEGFVGGGSGAQYFVGSFDGRTFTIDPRCSQHGDTVDFGPDFYAAITWSELPPGHRGPVWVGWMSNHQTGRFYPTQPWRGAQSLPRELFLFDEGDGLKLGQRPIGHATDRFEALSVETGPKETGLPGTFQTAFRLATSLKVEGEKSNRIELVAGDQTLLSLQYEQELGLVLRRWACQGNAGVSLAFESVAAYSAGPSINVEVFFDACLVDLFVDGGRRTFSTSIFPDPSSAVRLRSV